MMNKHHLSSGKKWKRHTEIEKRMIEIFIAVQIKSLEYEVYTSFFFCDSFCVSLRSVVFKC